MEATLLTTIIQNQFQPDNLIRVHHGDNQILLQKNGMIGEETTTDKELTFSEREVKSYGEYI